MVGKTVTQLEEIIALIVSTGTCKAELLQTEEKNDTAIIKPETIITVTVTEKTTIHKM
jgi:hypothetical protein